MALTFSLSKVLPQNFTDINLVEQGDAGLLDYVRGKSPEQRQDFQEFYSNNYDRLKEANNTNKEGLKQLLDIGYSYEQAVEESIPKKNLQMII